MTPEGNLVVLVHGGCETEVPNALPSLGKADVMHIRMLGALGPHQKVPVRPMICTLKLGSFTVVLSSEVLSALAVWMEMSLNPPL